MSQTRLDIELPYLGGNAPALRAGLAGEFPSVNESDITIISGEMHPEAYSNAHAVGLVFDVDTSNVSQTNVDTAIKTMRDILGTNILLLGWEEV